MPYISGGSVMNMSSVAFKKHGGKIETEVTRILHRTRENYITNLNISHTHTHTHTHTHAPFGEKGNRLGQITILKAYRSN